MNFQEVMLKLETMGTEQNRKLYKRHGAQDKMFGVSSVNFKLLVKKIKKNHELAKQLWATGNYDAQILATMIVDSNPFTEAMADEWIKQINSYPVGDHLVTLVSKTPFARAKSEEWIQVDDEFIARAGWHLLGQVAGQDNALPDTYFEPYLMTIEQDIHQQKNRTRQAMNNAIISIGSRNMGLQERALLTASHVGKVHIDHGETGCKTPDAAQYILKAAARKQPVK